MNDQAPKMIAAPEPELLLPAGESVAEATQSPEMITMPESVKMGIGQGAVELAKMPEMVPPMPGAEDRPSTYKDPTDVVARINEQLASRPDNAPKPMVQPGVQGRVTTEATQGSEMVPPMPSADSNPQL